MTSTSALLTSLLPLTLCLTACQPSQAQPHPRSAPEPSMMTTAQATPQPAEAPEAPPVEAVVTAPAAPTLSQQELRDRYVWLDLQDDLPELTSLQARFPSPAGFQRVEAPEGSYAAYLRDLPVRTDRTQVRLYDGSPTSMPSAAIIPLDLGSRDLHQCADSVIRLYAEYLWSVDQAQRAQFHYTSGDLAKWSDWRKGKILKVKGNRVTQVSTTPSPDTHRAYRSWLDKVFTYASTRSLDRDSEKIDDPKSLQPGDFFLQGGSPGHVVMLLDIAQDDAGQRVALIGQGYLPAREFHVISGAAPLAVDGAWYHLPRTASDTLATPTWAPFTMADAWRFDL